MRLLTFKSRNPLLKVAILFFESLGFLFSLDHM